MFYRNTKILIYHMDSHSLFPCLMARGLEVSSRQKIHTVYGNVQLFIQLPVGSRSHCKRGCCRQSLRVIPLHNGICCPCMTVTSTIKCQAWRPKTVTDLNRIPLINFIKGKFQCLANIVHQMVANMCSIWSREIFVWSSSVFYKCLLQSVPTFVSLMRSNASSNYKLVQTHMMFAWFVLSYASCRKQIGAGAPGGGIQQALLSNWRDSFVNERNILTSEVRQLVEFVYQRLYHWENLQSFL